MHDLWDVPQVSVSEEIRDVLEKQLAEAPLVLALSLLESRSSHLGNWQSVCSSPVKCLCLLITKGMC